MKAMSGQVLAMERNLPRSVIDLGFVVHPMGAPAVTPIANVVTTVNARCRWSRRVVSLRTFSAASHPCFATCLTASTPSSIARVIVPLAAVVG